MDIFMVTAELLSNEELFARLEKSHSIQSFVETYKDSFCTLSTTDLLEQLLQQHDLTKQYVIRKANIERKFGYQIFNGIRNPRRNTLVRIALTMKLTLEETQHLLSVSQRGELNIKKRRDAVLIFCILKNVSLEDTEIILDELSEALLK